MEEIGKQYPKDKQIDKTGFLENNNNRFIPVTYEKFIEKCRKFQPDENFKLWIEYLEKRYIVT